MKYTFKLFICGSSLNSALAIRNFKKLVRANLRDVQIDYAVVDVVQDPQSAIDYGILATPLLIKESPLPRVKIIGNLSEFRQVLSTVGLDAQSPAAGV